MPYPENFVLRLVICVGAMFVVWMILQFLAATFISHEAFTLRPIDIIVPAVIGTLEAVRWKPKSKM